MGAMGYLMAGDSRVTIHGDGFHRPSLQRDDQIVAQFAAAEPHHAVAEGESGVPMSMGRGVTDRRAGYQKRKRL